MGFQTSAIQHGTTLHRGPLSAGWRCRGKGNARSLQYSEQDLEGVDGAWAGLGSFRRFAASAWFPTFLCVSLCVCVCVCVSGCVCVSVSVCVCESRQAAGLRFRSLSRCSTCRQAVYNCSKECHLSLPSRRRVHRAAPPLGHTLFRDVGSAKLWLCLQQRE